MWQVLERLVEDPKFIYSSFNLANYETFVKKAILIKEMLEDEGVIAVSEKCSAIIKKELPILKKMKDSRNCTIPCHVGSEHFGKALCDLGSSISLMPTSVAIVCGIGI